MSGRGPHVLNWADEASKVADFLASNLRVAHVRGSVHAHPHHFVHLIETVLRERVGPDAIVCVLDPFDMATNTPLGCLRSIMDELNIPVGEVASRAAGHISGAVASNIRAFRDVVISNVDVTQFISYSEAEEFGLLRTAMIEFVESGVNLPLSVLIVPAVHHMEDSERRKFLSSLWSPLLRRLCGRGVKVVFMYCPNSLTKLDGALPPEPDVVIELPDAFTGESVKEELSQIIGEAGWHSPGSESLVAATVLMGVSDTVEDLYGNLAKIALKTG